MFEFEGVCEVTGLAEKKSIAASMIEATRKRGPRIDR